MDETKKETKKEVMQESNQEAELKGVAHWNQNPKQAVYLWRMDSFFHASDHWMFYIALPDFCIRQGFSHADRAPKSVL